MKYANKKSNKIIIYMLKKYKLLDYFSSLSLGIYSNAGINGTNLSLGMQKIIMVMRGILKENKNIIIFDEPLTSLDKKLK
jgi:ABC-type multidrug transport system fused ATPase/permease subunit